MKFRKIITCFVFIISLLLVVGCDFSGTTTQKYTIEKDSESFLDEAIVGEFDIREWRIIYVAEDSGIEPSYIQVGYDMLSTSDIGKLGKVGTHELTFTYKECTLTHTITIMEPSREYTLEKLNEAATPDLIPTIAKANIILPQSDGNIKISWSVESEYAVIKGYKAVVTRPLAGSSDAVMTLHAVFSLYSETLEKDYVVTIPAQGMEEVYQHLDDVAYAIKTPSSITNSLDLLFEYEETSVSWTSSNSTIISIDNEDRRVMVSQVIDETKVTLTATLAYQNVVYQNYISFEITVLPYSNIKKAPSVTNLKVTNNVLTWNSISGISNYNIYVNGVLKETVSTNRLLLTTIIKQSGLYTVGVQSVASGIYNTDSEIVTVSYTGVDSVGYTGTYYLSTNLTLSGNSLKTALRTLVSKTTHTTSYEELKTYNPITDRSLSDSSKIVLIYSRVETKGAWTSGGLYWNREHVWPQSQGWFSTSGAGSDLHHLRPEDPTLNSTRGNKPFGEVTGGTEGKLSAANKSVGSNCYYNSQYFEPQDSSKGDVARIIFYLLVRYSEADSYSITKVAQSMNLLLLWNEMDPVDEWEMNRNNAIENIQGNRNPFIDYPNLAEEIWG